MNILVTGGGGFLGRFLLEHLRRQSPKANVVGTGMAAIPALAPFHPCDLEKPAEVDALVQKVKPAAVYHLAGVSRVSSRIAFEQYFSKNTLTTGNLVRALERQGGRARFFLASSVHVYGQVSEKVVETTPARPESPYAFSKYLAEETLRQASARLPGFQAIIGRLYTCLGPGQPQGFVAADLCRKIRELKVAGGSRLATGPLTPYRRFQDVRDVVRALPLLMERTESPFEIYNIASPHELQIGQLLGILLEAAGVSPQIDSQPLDATNQFLGLQLDTRKFFGVIPDNNFRPIQESLRDMLQWEMTQHDS